MCPSPIAEPVQATTCPFFAGKNFINIDIIEPMQAASAAPPTILKNNFFKFKSPNFEKTTVELS